MKKIFSVSEFDNFCKEMRFKKYIFDTSNQKERLDQNIKLKTEYKIMMTFLAPNSICFKDNTSMMCIERVKNICVNTSRSNIGAVLNIICENTENPSKNKQYIFIAE